MTRVHLSLAVILMVILAVSVCHAHRRPWKRNRSRDRHDRPRDQPRSATSRWRDHFSRIFGAGGGLDQMDLTSGGFPFFNLDFRWGNSAQQEKNWWEGPNICKTESESHSNSSLAQHDVLRHFRTTSQSCDTSETAFKCKVTHLTLEGRREVTTVYHCCHGYSRVKGEFGCPTRHELTDLVSTAEAEGLTDFTRAVRLVQLTGLLEEGNVTLFAPHNGAFDLGLDGNVLPNNVDVMIGDTPDVIAVSASATAAAVESMEELVLSHVVSGTLPSAAIEDEQVLLTGNDMESTIRVNYFSGPEQIMMANCVPVTSRDVLATNGVLHSVERALTPVTESLLDLVKKREDLSTLKTVLAAAQYVSNLDEEGSLTLLAPTNSAFDKMNPRLKERLLRGDTACVQKLLQNNLLPNVICSGALSGQNRTPNLLKKLVNLTKTDDGKMFAHGAQMVQTDVMATNGVMHVLDEVHVPQEALDYLDVLEQQGFSEFLTLIEKAGLTKTLENTDNVTVFAPTNQAFQSLTESEKEQLANKDVLKETLSFHVSQGVLNCHRLHDNAKLPTLIGSDVRINGYQASPFHRLDHIKTAQCSPIQETNIQACNGRINAIAKVMLPPPGNVIDVLGLDRRFSRLVGLVKKSGMADILQEEGPFTIFAPNNEAFDSMDQSELDELTSEPKQLAALIKRHIFQNVLCCVGFRRSSWLFHPQVRVMSGERFTLNKQGEGQLSVGGVDIVTCDNMATNGVVLELDSVLPQRRSHSWGRFGRFRF